ncbi:MULTISPECIES: HAD family hydrolase [Halorussus]|uniref:HAD family hydrolase n=1 Tax=Halorussus TaxID=1070314 RepID=UPI00209E5F8B|nr:HAD family hydrolase [Halorussus vallis]USZ76489.1 HAD family hydrolase [Halorussus vallis]
MTGADPHWRAVFWDIGGVILNADSVRRAHREFVRRVVEEHAPETPVADALETWRAAVGDYFREREGTEFRDARMAYHRAVAEVVGAEIVESEWRPLFEAVSAETLEPNPGAVETVERLAETDLHVGVVSDVDAAEGRRILETFGIDSAFDSITTSEEVGRTKPDPAMFEAALSAAGVPAADAVMIGDRYEHDVEGAAALGLTTVAYGADDGPAVDYAVDDLREILSILGVEDAVDDNRADGAGG